MGGRCLVSCTGQRAHWSNNSNKHLEADTNVHKINKIQVIHPDPVLNVLVSVGCEHQVFKSMFLEVFIKSYHCF